MTGTLASAFPEPPLARTHAVRTYEVKSVRTYANNAARSREALAARVGYEEFIQSDAWRALKLMYRRSNLRQTCAVCDTSKHLHMHHLTYARFGGGERLEDLIPLCAEHHEALHAGGLTRRQKARVSHKPRPFATATTATEVEVKPQLSNRELRRIARAKAQQGGKRQQCPKHLSLKQPARPARKKGKR